MNIDYPQLAAATVSVLAPFLPYLTEVSKAGAKKLAETIAEQGGETVWKQAQALWSKIERPFKQDDDARDAARMLARKPGDEIRRIQLTEILVELFNQRPDLVQEILPFIENRGGIQRVLASEEGWVEKVKQRMGGSGYQSVEAKGKGKITDVSQEQYSSLE